MAFCFLLIAAFFLNAGAEDTTKDIGEVIQIDPSDDGDSESDVFRRVPRQVHEGSGMWDFNIDDEDTVPEYGSTNIVSSRVIPEASSPTFRYPQPPATSRQSPAATKSPRLRNGPARPPRLTSYYPDLRQEGSGGGEDLISSLGHYNDSDLISPTRTLYPGDVRTSMVPPTPNMATSPPNHEPFVGNRLDKVPLVAGKSSRVIIPANTFQDLEDGDTRDLSLKVIDKDTGSDIDHLDWVTFRSDTQEIISLPLEENIGIYKFRVVAYDSGGASTADELVMAVRQHQVSRNFHHEFHASFQIVDKDQWRHPVDWKLSLLDSLVTYHGDQDPGGITILEMSENNGVIKVRWTNDSLPRQSCPKQQIINLYGRMTSNERPSQSFKSAFHGHFRVRDISLEYRGVCSVRHSDPVTSSPDRGGQYGGGAGYDNSMPDIRNPVDKLNVTAGELLQFQVPADMCWDREDGPTRDLNLQLLTLSRLEVDSDNWLQFDVKNQEFIGVPLENDVGREEYQLVCSDNEGYSSIDGIEVLTLSRPFLEKFNVMFVFLFNDTLDDGIKLSRSRVKIMKKIARIFRDEDTRHIVLSKVDPVTLEVAWYNKTYSSRDCPVDEIFSTKRFLMEKDGSVRPRVVQVFEPNFHLADIKMLMLGNCLEIDTIQTHPDTTGDPIYDLLPPQEYIIAFVVPALIIVGMLLLAVLIACVLHKKRKAGKLDMFRTETLPPRIPVIMQDELHEDNFNVSKQPIILREEPDHYSSYRPPNYYGSSRMDEEFSECESLVNGVSAGSIAGAGYHGHGHTLPSHAHTYARPPPVALEFSDSMSRRGHRPAPMYRRQQFNP